MRPCGWGPWCHVVRQRFKGTIHRPNCLFYFNICGVQRTSLKSVLQRTNQPEHPVLVSVFCLWFPFRSLRCTSLFIHFPPAVSCAFVASIVSLLELCSHLQRKHLLLHPASWTNKDKNNARNSTKLCVYELLLSPSELHIMSFTYIELLIIQIKENYMVMIKKKPEKLFKLQCEEPTFQQCIFPSLSS